MPKKIIVIFSVIMVLISQIAYGADSQKPKDGTSNTMQNIILLPPDSLDTTLDNGVLITIENAQLGWQLAYERVPNCYSQKVGSLFTKLTPIFCNGVQIKITNTSKQLYVIKWSESNITIGNYSGMPFLDGMKYKDAGNPSATPDSVLPPGKTIDKTVFVSRVTFDGDNWNINGEPIPKDNSMRVNLYLKITDQTSAAKYYTITSPAIGLPQ